MNQKLFDFVTGNPPYQASNSSNNRQEPIYPYFYDAAEKVADKYMLISPARFLFNAGFTSKEWNKKMLADKHLKVEYYNQNATEIFSNTDIKGGVVIMYRDSESNFGAIEEFIPDENLRKIAAHVKSRKQESISSIMVGGSSDLKFNDECMTRFPTIKQDRIKAIQKKHPDVNDLAPNEEYELKSSAFDVLPYVFHKDMPEGRGYYEILGLQKF